MPGMSMRTLPRSAPAAGRNIPCNWSASVSNSLQRARKASPSGVSRTLRVVRCSRRPPTSASSACTKVETRPLAMPSSSAALVKLASSATRLNILNSFRSMPLFFLTKQFIHFITIYLR